MTKVVGQKLFKQVTHNQSIEKMLDARFIFVLMSFGLAKIRSLDNTADP